MIQLESEAPNPNTLMRFAKRATTAVFVGALAVSASNALHDHIQDEFSQMNQHIGDSLNEKYTSVQ